MLLIVLACANNFAQNEVSVEKSVFGIQSGFLGIWVHNESRLTNDLVLRSEIGFDADIYKGVFYNGEVLYDNTEFALFPTIYLEPRYYYNLTKRQEKGKNISKNSGNFIGLKVSYKPDWFSISSFDKGIRSADNIAIIPKWAIKRTLGKHFTYEAGIGLGYRYYFLKQYGFAENDAEAALDLHIRFGYTF